MLKFNYRLGLILIFAVITVGVFSSCQKEKAKKVEKPQFPTVTVQPQTSSTTLYFSGSIAPLRRIDIISPVDGVISQLFFNYGDSVEEGEELVIIDSPDLSKEYQDALTSFLQAKEKYSNNQKTMVGTEELFKAGLISKNDFIGN